MQCTFSPELFAGWIDGQIEDRELIEEMLVHLTALCPTCRESWFAASRQRTPGAAWFRELQREGKAQGLPAEEAIARAIRYVEEHKDKALQAEDREAAAELVEGLDSLEAVERGMRITALPPDGVRLELARILLQQSRACASDDAELAVVRAEEAAQAANAAFLPRFQRLIATDIRAVAAGAEANGYRLLGQYAMANVCIAEAYRLADEGTGDPVAFADILSFRASLLRDQSRAQEAEPFIRDAISIYRKVGAEHRAGRAYLQLAAVYYDLNDPGKSAAAMGAALKRLDAEKDPETIQITHENRALVIAEAGDPARAREILDEHPSPPDRPERYRLQREWIEHRITGELGDHAAAAAGLEETRKAFAAMGDAPNAATATLDLALLYANSGQVEAMLDTAAEALPLLLPLNLPDEVLSSLMMLQEAAQAKTVSLALLRRLQRSFSRAATWRS